MRLNRDRLNKKIQYIGTFNQNYITYTVDYTSWNPLQLIYDITIHSFILIVSFVKSNDNQKMNTQNIKNIKKTMVITTLDQAG